MIIKLNRRKRKCKKIIFIVLGILLFLCCSFLSGFILLNIFRIIKYISVLLIGNLGSFIVFGSVGIVLGIKIISNEIRNFMVNNYKYKLSEKCDEERKKLYVVKSGSLCNVECVNKNSICNNFNNINLRIVNNECENVVVKRRVRKKEDFSRHR